ncbi:MAG: M48 family metallopeptidase [Rhodanobacter sp.]
MDFFARQAHVRVSSRYLMVLFALSVIVIVAAIDFLVLIFFGFHRHFHPGQPVKSNVSLMVFSSIATLAFIMGSSLYRMMSLSKGGKAVAERVGAVPVPLSTADPRLRQLRNVIEEVAIAAGTPVPDIYLMEDEPGINAFAAGYSPSDAAICVTQGCMDHLTRDELQGVIAHEFSHVLNGDMRLNIRLMGWLFGIMMIATMGRRLMYSSPSRYGSRDAEDNVRGSAIGMVIFAIGYVGFFFGRLIQAGIARERESLADAAAVQFTRQTAGISGALKKMAVLDEGSELQIANRHEVAHMLFGDADTCDTGTWYATHPPMVERIRALEPWFRESQLARFAETMQSAPANQETTRTSDREATAPMTSSGAAPSPSADDAGALALTEQRDAGPGSFQHAGLLQQSMPAKLTNAVQQPESALLLVLALAMSAHREVQIRQRRLIADAFGDDVKYATIALTADVEALSSALRMPLVSLAFPALKQLSDGRLQTFLSTLNALVHADSQVDLDEYCLARLLRVQLLEAMQPRRTPVDGQKKLPACRDSVMFVCAVVAAYGSNDDAEARRAWLLAMDQAFPGVTLSWQRPPLDWQAPFERALMDLDGLMPVAKEILIQSLLSAIRADGVVTVVEAELLRVICASLHCPLPPQSGVEPV